MRIELGIIFATWQRFWYAFHASQRIDDLKRLVQWAKRKRLTQISGYYRHLLTQELLCLKACRSYHPQTVIWARRFYKFKQLWVSVPRYYSKGAAAAYRHRRA